MDVKLCSRCNTSKPVESFYFLNTGKYHTYCKACVKARNQAHAAKVKTDPARQHKKNKRARIRMHGLTLEEYDRMQDEQRGLCKVCRLPPLNGRQLQIDHDHKCCPGSYSCGLCVRGLLCENCNRALGMVKDDATTLLKLVVYLGQPLDLGIPSIDAMREDLVAIGGVAG